MTSADATITVVDCVDDSGGEKKSKYYLSLLPADLTFKHGLIPEAIVGELKDKPLEGAPVFDRTKFVANSVFKDFLHAVIASCAENSMVVAEAQRIGRGIVTVIDRRVPDLNAAIAPEDIFGGFIVENGIVTEYSRNPNHVLFNQFGFFKLEPIIQVKLNSALTQILDHK